MPWYNHGYKRFSSPTDSLGLITECLIQHWPSSGFTMLIPLFRWVYDYLITQPLHYYLTAHTFVLRHAKPQQIKSHNENSLPPSLLMNIIIVSIRNCLRVSMYMYFSNSLCRNTGWIWLKWRLLMTGAWRKYNLMWSCVKN